MPEDPLAILHETREAYLSATLAWQATHGVTIDGKRVGGLCADDPTYRQARSNFYAAQQAYHSAYAACATALQVARQEELQSKLLTLRNNWLQQQYPALVTEVFQIREDLPNTDPHSAAYSALRHRLQEITRQLEYHWQQDGGPVRRRALAENDA